MKDNYRQQFKKGLWEAIPISISTFIFGALFGVLAVQSGLSYLESTAMSVLSFAGAAQLSILPVIGDIGLGTIFFMTFSLNARHLLYGLSLSSHLQHVPEWKKHIIGFLLSDSMYAMANKRLKTEKMEIPYVIGLGLTVYLAWGLGTGIGALFTQRLMTTDLTGLAFASTACFIILLVAELTTLHRLLTCMICSLFVVAIAPYSSTGVLLLVTGLLAFSVGIFSEEDV